MAHETWPTMLMITSSPAVVLARGQAAGSHSPNGRPRHHTRRRRQPGAILPLGGADATLAPTWITTAFGIFPRRGDGQSVDATVEVAWMVNAASWIASDLSGAISVGGVSARPAAVFGRQIGRD